MGKKPENKLVQCFRFDKATVDTMQGWIDAGYFEDDADIAVNAYQILFKVMALIEEDKQVIEFSKVTIGMQVDFPKDLKENHSVQ